MAAWMLTPCACLPASAAVAAVWSITTPAISHLMKLNPAVSQLLMEHALDTDDVETSSGVIIMRLRHKAVSLRHAPASA